MTAKLPLTLCLILLSAIVYPIEAAPQDLKATPVTNKLDLQLNQFAFSWNAIDQTAYRVLVASDLPKLNANQGDLWDSGEVESPQSSGIRHTGKRLTKGKKAHWKIRGWNTPNQAEPALKKAKKAPAWPPGTLNKEDHPPQDHGGEPILVGVCKEASKLAIGTKERIFGHFF